VSVCNQKEREDTTKPTTHYNKKVSLCLQTCVALRDMVVKM